MMEPFRVLNAPELIEISDKEQRLFSRIGQILKAQVVERLSENRFFLRFGERLIMAETMIPLKENEEIKVRVEALKPKITLKLLHPEQASNTRDSALLLNAIAQKRGLAEFIERFLQYENASQLKEVINQILADERRLFKKDFWKQLAQNLLGEAQTGDKESSLQKTILSLFSHKEDKQLLDFFNQFGIMKVINTHLKFEGIYLQIPYWFEQKVKDVEIFIGKEPQNKNLLKEKPHYFFRFRLHLELLGCIEGLVKFLSNQEVSVELATEKEQTAKLIDSYLYVLQNKLLQQGFKIKRCSCQLLPDLAHWRQDFCLPLLNIEDNLLDVKV